MTYLHKDHSFREDASVQVNKNNYFKLFNKVFEIYYTSMSRVILGKQNDGILILYFRLKVSILSKSHQQLNKVNKNIFPIQILTFSHTIFLGKYTY